MSANEWSSDETGRPLSSSSPPEEAFRPTSGRITGVVLVGLGVLVLGLAVFDRRNVDPWVGGVAAAVAVLGWAYLLRPRVRVSEGALLIRNPFSTVRIPLAAIEEVAVRQVLVVGLDGRRITSPGLGRTRASLVKRPGTDTADSSPHAVASSYGEFAEDRIRHHMDAARTAAGVRHLSDEQAALAAGLERRPAWPEILGLAVSVLATVVLAVAG